MASESPSKIVYEGEVYHIDFNPDRLDELEEQLAPIVDVAEDEKLVVSPNGEDALEVQKLRKRE